VAGTKYDQSIQWHDHETYASNAGQGHGGDSPITVQYAAGWRTGGTGSTYTRQRGVSIPLYLKIR
jgi:hypothetical protein